MPATPDSPGQSPGEMPTAHQAQATLQTLNQDLARLQRTIRMAITEKLQAMEGLSLGSLEANRQLVATISELIDSHGLRIRCPHCGHPAILRVSPRKNTSGVFVFDHTINGKRTFHGGKTVLPALRLVAKPPRQQRRKRPTDDGKLAS